MPAEERSSTGLRHERIRQRHLAAISNLVRVPESELPREGMTISLRLRRDLVIVDPGRFLAAARRAYHDLNPDLCEAQVVETIGDVHDAVFALLDHEDGRTLIWPDIEKPEVGPGAPLPGERALDRPDGLSPAGWLLEVVLDECQPLQDYGCFLPDDPFARRPQQALDE